MTMTTVPVPLTGFVPDGVTFDMVLITPDIAAEMLTHNTLNRNLKLPNVRRYKADMETGDWVFNGEPIRFGDDGRLLDGQNRLHAIIESGVTLPFLVIRGLPDRSQDITDNGAPRKFYDVLHMRGEPNATHLAALVRRVAAWDSGSRRHLNSVVTSYAALDRTLTANPELREVIAPARRAAAGSGLTPSVACLTYWLFSRIDPEDADYFFARLTDGQSLAKGDPIFELRRTLHDSRTVKATRGETYLVVITIKAWNAYRAGEKVSIYRWRPGGANPEQFPEPV